MTPCGLSGKTYASEDTSLRLRQLAVVSGGQSTCDVDEEPSFQDSPSKCSVDTGVVSFIQDEVSEHGCTSSGAPLNPMGVPDSWLIKVQSPSSWGTQKEGRNNQYSSSINSGLGCRFVADM